MRSTSCSAQHFKSDKELFLESCHPFKAELMADQHFDRADMCPSAVAEPLGYTFFPPGIVALKYRTCLLADLTLVKAHKGGGGCGSAAWQVAIDGWRRDLRYRLHNASNRDSTALTLEDLRIASLVPVAFDPKRTSLTFVHIRRREWATASSKRSRPKPRRCLGAKGHGDAVNQGSAASLCIWFAGGRPRSACLFGPEFTPALRTDLAVDDRAGVRLLEERAIAALLIVLWCVLIVDRFLAHFCGSFCDEAK